jgi:fluoride ion exporter CrcB/FEX
MTYPFHLSSLLFCQLKELTFLKERCKDADPVINITACQGVMTLVETGILGAIPTLSSFIAALPTVRFVLS